MAFLSDILQSFSSVLVEQRAMAGYLPALYSMLQVGGIHITLTVSSTNISFETNLQNEVLHVVLYGCET